MNDQNFRGAAGWRRWTGLIFGALLGASASGATDPAVQLDTTLQGLKEEAVLLNRDLDSLQQAVSFPLESRVSFYVINKVGGFLIDQVVVIVNDGNPTIHDYTDSEARALLNDGWHRILTMRLEPGTYRLHVEFKGHFFDARPSDPPLFGKMDQLFEKGLSPLDKFLPIARNTRLDRPALSEVAGMESVKRRPGRNVWMQQADSFEPALHGDKTGGKNDPRWHEALFLREDKRYLSALTELLEVAESVSDPSTLAADYDFLLADCYLDFGLEGPAERLYRLVADTKTDPVEVTRARMRLAEFQYQRGYQSDAVQTLQNLREKMPSTLLDDWRLLLANVLLAQGRYNEAVELLNADAGHLPAVQRYNLAVALITDGRVEEGRKQLNKVGTMDVRTPEDLALRDKANLTLGYQYLQGKQGDNAREVFGRIRVDGPFSNRALLGLGWAELAPVTAEKAQPVEAEGKTTGKNSLGTVVRPGFVDPKLREQLKQQEKNERTLSEADQQAVLRALVPWVDLAKRDPMDAAVEEGMLAIAWALDRLQAYQQSLQRYQDAIAALEKARGRMDQAKQSILNGTMIWTMIKGDLQSERGWTWSVTSLADTPETYFLQSLLAEHRFQEPLKNYRDSRMLVGLLDSWRGRLAQLESSGSASAASLQRQLAHARKTGALPWAGTSIWLAFEPALAAPGSYDAPAATDAHPPLDLRLVDPPARFEGNFELLEQLRNRVDDLRGRLDATSREQNKQLEKISLNELDGQKREIERYLTEARFAVARIYDRQRKGG